MRQQFEQSDMGSFFDENLWPIIAFALIMFVLFQVLFFFKIWNMTSDVATIRKLLESKTNNDLDVKKELNEQEASKAV